MLDQLLVAAEEVVFRLRAELGIGLGFYFRQVVLDLQEQLGERCGPDLLFRTAFLDEDEVAQEVRLTEAVATLLRPLVGREASTHQRAGDLREDADLVHRRCAPACVGERNA